MVVLWEPSGSEVLDSLLDSKLADITPDIQLVAASIMLFQTPCSWM